MHLVLVLFFLAFALSFSISLLFFYKFRNVNRVNVNLSEQLVKDDFTDPSLASCSLSKLIEDSELKCETKATHLPHSSVLDFLGAGRRELEESTGGGEGTGRERTRKKKKRAKKKKVEVIDEFAESEGREQLIHGGFNVGGDCDGLLQAKSDLACLYPFTSTSSAIQRKIKQRYDELVRCNEANELTIVQVGEFANSLAETKNELQIKSEAIKRKFSIAKALLFKADRSSIERQRQQIYKLEIEQKRLEEDALVCGWLQQQLRLSPAYSKMLEISSCIDQGKTDEAVAHEDPDISFEELLAQEKKDSFWQKNAKLRQPPSQQ